MHNPHPHPHRPAAVPPSHQGKFVQILDQAARAGRDSADLSAADLNALGEAVETAIDTYMKQRQHGMPSQVADELREVVAQSYNAVLLGTPMSTQGQMPRTILRSLPGSLKEILSNLNSESLIQEMRKAAYGKVASVYYIDSLASTIRKAVQTYAAQRTQGQTQGAAIG